MTLSIQTILALLARREHSKLELRNKLTRQFGHHPLIPTLLDECEAKGYLSDDRFTEQRVRALLNKSKGYRFIYNDLKTKGISHETIAKHLTITDNSWLDLAESLL